MCSRHVSIWSTDHLTLKYTEKQDTQRCLFTVMPWIYVFATALTTSGLYSSMGITYYFDYSKRWLNIQHINISKAIKNPKTILMCAWYVSPNNVHGVHSVKRLWTQLIKRFIGTFFTTVITEIILTW